MTKDILIIALIVGVVYLIVLIGAVYMLVLYYDSMATMDSLYHRFHSDLDDFNEEMIILAETLQTYHELLDDYQIPMIANPTKTQRDAIDSSGW